MDVRSPQADQEAFLEGQRAGQLRLAAGLNPHEPGTSPHAEWERGRRSVEAQQRSAELRARARTAPCRYRLNPEPCDCGGRGLCLDVA